MKIVALADIHGAQKNLRQLQEVLAAADLVLLVGDIGRYGNLESGREIVKTAIDAAQDVLAVAGNCDAVALELVLAEVGISLHANVAVRNDIQFAGLGGSLPCPSTTPHEYSDEQLGEFLDTCRQQLKPGPHILVSHQPPLDTKTDFANIGRHVGSRAVRTYIEETQPLACVCGHIHEGRGIDHIGDTVVVNPGTFAQGFYAEIALEGEIVDVRLRCF